MNLNIHDEAGDSWITNAGEFRMPHPTRDGLIFEPGQATKVNLDDWISSQPVLSLTTDPLAPPAEAKPEKKPKAEKPAE